MKRMKKRKGFTIVELVIVIAVIAILATTLVPTFGNVIQNAKDSAAKQEAKNAFTSYMIEHPELSGSLFVYQTDGRYVAIQNGAPIGIYDTQAEACKALGLDEDAQFSDTGVDKLLISGDAPITPSEPTEPPIQPEEPIQPTTFTFAEKYGTTNWLAGKSFGANGIIDGANYFVNNEVIKVAAGTVIYNPDPTTYYFAVGYCNTDGTFIRMHHPEGSLSNPFSSYEFEEDAYVRICIRFIDGRTMTDDLKNDILSKFTVSVPDTAPTVSQEMFAFTEMYSNITWIAGKAFTNTSLNDDHRYFVSQELIDIKAGSRIINPDINTYHIVHALYDSNGNMLGSIDYTNYEEFTIDEDCKIRIAIKFVDNRTMTDAEKDDILSKFTVYTFGPAPAKKLTCSFLGDSITEGINTTKTYHEYLAEWCNIEALNYGANGSHISTYILDESKHSYCMVERVETVAKNSDIVFVFGGTNDFNRGCPMGTFESKDKNTFKGALAVMLQYLKDNFADKTIYLMTPIHRGEFSGQLTDLQANAQGLYLTDYVNAIKEAGELFDYEVIDLYNLTGMNPNETADANTYFHNSGSIDNLHPNAEGHRVIAETIKEYLGW